MSYSAGVNQNLPSEFTYEKFVAPLSFELASQGCVVSAAFWVENSNALNSEPNNENIEIIDLKLSRSKKIIYLIKNIYIILIILLLFTCYFKFIENVRYKTS